MGTPIIEPASSSPASAPGFPPAQPTKEARSQGRRFSTANPRESVEEALRYGREYDALGHHIHTVLALIYLFLLPLATAPKDWAFGLLTVWTIIRLPHTWWSYRAFLRMPLTWAALAWVAWQATSLLWSDHLAQGWDELKVQRMLVTPLLLWPVLDRAPWLVMAALGGTLAQNGMQAAQHFGWIDAGAGDNGRLRGLIHPIHAGMWFGTAMVLHLSAVLNAHAAQRWLWRTVSAALLIVSGAGLVATGSRGPWIAGAAALIAALLVIPLRRRRARTTALVIALGCALAGGAIMTVGQALVRERLRDAQREIEDARTRQIYWTSTGLRLALWNWAWQVWQTSPVIGVGAGDLRASYEQLPAYAQACQVAREQSMLDEVPGYQAAKDTGEDVTKLRLYRRGLRTGELRIEYLSRDHAHSTYLHTLANQGLIGFALLMIVLWVVLRQCWSDRPDYPYSDGMLCVLLCWIIGAQFDCYELNGHQLGLIAFIAALTLPGRAAVRWRWSART